MWGHRRCLDRVQKGAVVHGLHFGGQIGCSFLDVEVPRAAEGRLERAKVS